MVKIFFLLLACIKINCDLINAHALFLLFLDLTIRILKLHEHILKKKIIIYVMNKFTENRMQRKQHVNVQTSYIDFN